MVPKPLYCPLLLTRTSESQAHCKRHLCVKWVGGHKTGLCADTAAYRQTKKIAAALAKIVYALEAQTQWTATYPLEEPT